jgi:hypothetical protein
LIAFPQTVTFMLEPAVQVDPAKIEEQLRNLPGLELPPPDFGPPR